MEMNDGGSGFGMDAFGGYGQDLGVSPSNSTASTGADDYFGGGYTGSGFGSIGGNYGSDFGDFDGGMSLAQWGTPGYQSQNLLGNEINQSFNTDSRAYGTDLSSESLGTSRTGPDDTFSNRYRSFMGTPLGRIANLALSLNPSTRMAMGALNATMSASRGNLGPAVGMGLGAITGNSMIGQLGNIGTQAAQGRNVAGAIGSTLGGYAGGVASQSPIGSMIGSQIGGAIGNSVGATPGINGNATANRGINTQGNEGDFNGALANLADIYASNRASRDTSRNISSLQANTPQVSLESLYGPNSPYATQLRQQLERKDASAGRRSQYGPREVELQARLADMYSRAAPSYVQANIQNQNAISQQQAIQAQRRNQTLASIYGLARNSGALNSIGNLFQNSNAPSSVDYVNNIVPSNQYIEPNFTELTDLGIL